MAGSTTPRKFVLVTGPPWWGDRYLTRTGRPTPLRPPDARVRRRTEANDEIRGLRARLDRLPDDCVVMFTAGSGGVADQVALWATAADRQTFVAPVVDEDRCDAAFDLMVDVVLALTAAGSTVATFVCVVKPDDPELVAVGDRGLAVWPVHPTPEPPGEVEPSPSGAEGRRKEGQPDMDATPPDTAAPTTTAV